MGRLVDIDDVKDLLLGLDSLPWEEQVDDVLKSLPTAYDAKKVVKQLKENAHTDFSWCDHVELDKAIEIVRKGGVE